MRSYFQSIPRIFIYLAMIFTTLALIPPALIARSRVSKSTKPPLHYIQDMDAQAKFKAQQTNTMFADSRAMRAPIDHTVARGELFEDDHLHLGVVNGGWAEDVPAGMSVDMAMLQRGHARFNIYCTPCHGYAGYGDGVVNVRAMDLLQAGINGTSWVQAKSLHDPTVRVQPVGQIYNTIAYGLNNMAGYAAQIPVEDRWAIAAYVKALQFSQDAEPTALEGVDPGALETRDLYVAPATPAEDDSAATEEDPAP
jgi:mono/diheme cytochrome c family protein